MDPISHIARTDLAIEATAPRPTPNSGVAFRDIVSRSASSLTRDAQAAITQLPGGPVLAAAMRGLPLGGQGGAGATTSLAGQTSLPTISTMNGSVLSTSPTLPSIASPVAVTSPATSNPLAHAATPSATTSAEGPGAVGTGAGSSGVESSLQSSQDMNLYYLQLQEAMAAENRQYSACSNVLKARHDTVKNAIGNIR